MTLTELFQQLSTRGLTVQRIVDNLGCRGDQSLLTDELKQALQEHRQEFLRLLPEPMSDDEVQRALTDLAEFLNREMPDDYRLSCNPNFWTEFDQQTEQAVAAREARAFDLLKSKAKEEFNHFVRMLSYPCEICGHVPWYACHCEWTFQMHSRNCSTTTIK